jgi:dephospho-CoA kinase
MLKVGLTGGIGSGKTTVARIFTSFGVPVFFADLEARILMESSEEIIHSLKSYFGDEVYKGSELNRVFLANVVFKDPIKLKKLNQLIHPAVHRRFESWTNEQQEAIYLIEEAALLCETEAYKYFDYLVLVISPCNKRIERVMLRDGVSEEDVISRMKSQMPDEEKIPLAHFLIFNDDENMLVNQVLAFHEKMISLNNK